MRRITFSVCISVAAGGALVTVSPAPAQETCYKITDLGALGFTPGSDTVFGVNNADEAVFTAVVGGKKHAMLYLPAPAYLLTEGCHDLHTLAGLHADAESAAYEINDQGMAVGWADIEVQPGIFEQHALVWQINDYNPLILPLPTIDLADFSVPNNGAPKIQVPTVAWAINNAVPPVVVGDASGLTNCACPPSEEQVCTILGFKAVLDEFEVLQELLPIVNPPICDFESRGRDISSLAVGYSDNTGGVCLAEGVPCANRKDAVGFSSTGAPVALTDLSDGGSESRGVNDGGAIVGWGFQNPDVPCLSQGLFWPSIGAAPVNLGSLLPPAQETGAEAINNLANPQVVGWNDTTDHALLWKCDGPDCNDPLNWSVTDLNDTIQDCSTSWSLVQAHDLTDAATPSIVGWGLRSGVKHGFLLTPDPACCPADLDGDGTVGSFDLLILLTSWGPCPNCGECGAECVADLDCDCNVGASDKLILLIAWGPCDGGSSHHDLDALEEAVEEMGYDDLEDYQAWLAQASEPEALASGWVLYALLTDGE